ncbi:hypothetical protein F2Q69_00029202 [Brassica cretica]|uniref:Uncharacterized protein n=1 Tax=Brassica cretica TaxID=69181 RepID=A0A8S9SCX9_BRACR|nr:hypothetical protein F2Q69_00029202 [Brassica cretica]
MLDSHNSKIGYNHSPIVLMVFDTHYVIVWMNLFHVWTLCNRKWIQFRDNSILKQPSLSIDRRTRPSIDGDYAARRSKLVTEKTLQDKLDEITLSQDFLKEDVYQELKDISETTHARLGMQ